MKTLPCLVAAALAAGLAAPVAAQSAKSDVRAVIDRLFDGMRTGDAAAVQAVMHEDVRFMTSVEEDGEAVVRAGDVQQFIAAVGDHEGVWDEQIYDVVVQVDDNMATVWAPFTFYFDGRLSHCGVNSFQLARTGGAWKVVHLIDTRRRGAVCPDVR